MSQNTNNKNIATFDEDVSMSSYNAIKKLAGIKIQEDGSLTRPDDIYDVKVADFIVEIDRTFLSKFTNKEAADIVKKGIDSYKEQLTSNGLKILGSHMRSNPPENEPHITLSVVADEKLNIIVDNMNN